MGTAGKWWEEWDDAATAACQTNVKVVQPLHWRGGEGSVQQLSNWLQAFPHSNEGANNCDRHGSIAIWPASYDFLQSLQCVNCKLPSNEWIEMQSNKYCVWGSDNGLCKRRQTRQISAGKTRMTRHGPKYRLYVCFSIDTCRRQWATVRGVMVNIATERRHRNERLRQRTRRVSSGSSERQILI